MMRTVATLVSLLPIALVCTLSSGRIFCSQEIDHQNSSIILDIVVSQLKIDFKGNSNMKNKNQHINTPGGGGGTWAKRLLVCAIPQSL